MLISRGILWLFPAKRAALAPRRCWLGNGGFTIGDLVLAHARAVRQIRVSTTAFAGKTTGEREGKDGSDQVRVISVKGCCNVGVCSASLTAHLYVTDL
jgi:hypothetical protein